MWRQQVNSYLAMVLLGSVALMASILIIKMSRLEPTSAVTISEALSIY